MGDYSRLQYYIAENNRFANSLTFEQVLTNLLVSLGYNVLVNKEKKNIIKRLRKRTTYKIYLPNICEEDALELVKILNESTSILKTDKDPLISINSENCEVEIYLTRKEK